MWVMWVMWSFHQVSSIALYAINLSCLLWSVVFFFFDAAGGDTCTDDVRGLFGAILSPATSGVDTTIGCGTFVVAGGGVFEPILLQSSRLSSCFVVFLGICFFLSRWMVWHLGHRIVLLCILKPHCLFLQYFPYLLFVGSGITFLTLFNSSCKPAVTLPFFRVSCSILEMSRCI